MNRRVTIRDVARAAGVHLSSAARALKNDPRISEVTRKKVREAAEKLDYTSDPMLAAFAAYRQKVRASSFHGTLAWVTNYPERHGWRNQAADLYFTGAQKRARELGYNLEEFWQREPGMTAKRASSILVARGIRGLLICPQSRSRGHLRLAWDQFASVTFGYSLVQPHIHRVSTSHFRSVITAVRHLRALGYRRIGWATPRHMDDRTDRLWTGAFHTEMATLPESRDIPPFATDYEKPKFLAWMKKWRPQALITTDVLTMWWLKEGGYPAPEKIGIASLNLQQSEDNPVSGVDERSEVIGATAIDLLAGMLQRGEYGIPRDPLVVLVEGTWVTGKTTMRQKGAR